jgi:hypothetical protein
MRLNVKGLAVALALAWGGGVFLAGAAHEVWPGYGVTFLQFAASIYPGYHVGGFGGVIIGTLYALLDGAVSGALVAWLYNAASTRLVAA